MDFSKQKCVACSGSEKPLSEEKINLYMEAVPDWTHEKKQNIDILKRNIKQKDFLSVVDLVNKIAQLAEDEGHHPNLLLHDYNQLEIEIYTHKIKGLHENDFILAQKISTLLDD
jgi:4a-hydroxytetrahydrobiopterin dehydratase